MRYRRRRYSSRRRGFRARRRGFSRRRGAGVRIGYRM